MPYVGVPELLEELARKGPCTAKELANSLGGTSIGIGRELTRVTAGRSGTRWARVARLPGGLYAILHTVPTIIHARYVGLSVTSNNKRHMRLTDDQALVIRWLSTERSSSRTIAEDALDTDMETTARLIQGLIARRFLASDGQRPATYSATPAGLEALKLYDVEADHAIAAE